MRLTQVVCQQHIGQWFKKKWYYMRNRVPKDSGAEEILRNRNINVIDGFKFLYSEQPTHIPIEHFEPKFKLSPKPIEKIDVTNSLWNDEECHILSDDRVVIYGLEQAQHITKALHIQCLPQNIQNFVESTEFTPTTDRNIKNAILNAHLFDAEQKKLIKKKNPEKPMWVFKRDVGITDSRKNGLIISKILQECERLSGQSFINRKIVNDARIVLPFAKDGLRYQFDFTIESLVASKKSISPVSSISSLENLELPDIYPMKCNISLPVTNYYKRQLIYPISSKSAFVNPHTIFLHYSDLDVKNIHQSPVTENQIESRSLLKAFAVAAARAQQKFGNNVKDLPSPITVQSVQVNGNKFQFGVFQLNTLNLDGTEGVKNYWFSNPIQDLYDVCAYLEARPKLSGYNPSVLKNALAFYKN